MRAGDIMVRTLVSRTQRIGKDEKGSGIRCDSRQIVSEGWQLQRLGQESGETTSMSRRQAGLGFYPWAGGQLTFATFSFYQIRTLLRKQNKRIIL